MTALYPARHFSEKNGKTVLHFLNLLLQVQQGSLNLTAVGFGLGNGRFIRHTGSHHGTHGTYAFAPVDGGFLGNTVLLVEHQQGIIKIGDIGYQGSTDSLFVLQALKIESFGTAFGIRQLTENVDFPTDGSDTGISP